MLDLGQQDSPSNRPRAPDFGERRPMPPGACERSCGSEWERRNERE